MAESKVGPPAVTAAQIRGWMLDRIAHYTRRQPGDLDPDADVRDLGLASVQAMALVGDLGERFGLDLDPAAAWAFPSPTLLSQFVHEELAHR